MRDETSTWLSMADEDWAAARVLLDAGLRRSTVFHVHLTVEKTLKALVWEATGAQPPKIHHLMILARLAGLDLPPLVDGFLGTLNREGIEARYAQTPAPYPIEFCERMMTTAGEVLPWLRQRVT